MDFPQPGSQREAPDRGDLDHRARERGGAVSEVRVHKDSRTCSDRTYEQYLSVSSHEESEDHWARTFHNLVLRGKLQTELSWIT